MATVEKGLQLQTAIEVVNKKVTRLDAKVDALDVKVGKLVGALDAKVDAMEKRLLAEIRKGRND